MRSVGKASVALRSSGRAFLAATGGAAAAEAGTIAHYLGTKSATFINASARQDQVAGKVIQGTVDLATQIPTVVALTGMDDTDTAEDIATTLDFTQGMADNVGDWTEMGAAQQRKLARSPSPASPPPSHSPDQPSPSVCRRHCRAVPATGDQAVASHLAVAAHTAAGELPFHGGSASRFRRGRPARRSTSHRRGAAR